MSGSSLSSFLLVPPPDADRPLFIDALPTEVATHILDFLPKWDIGTLLRVSKRAWHSVVLALRTWKYKGVSDQCELMKRAANLRHLYADVSTNDPLMEAIEEGMIGDRLHSLHINFHFYTGESGSAASARVFGCLEAGRLPLLKELDLQVRLERQETLNRFNDDCLRLANAHWKPATSLACLR